MSFSSPGFMSRKDPSKSRTWKEWTMAMMNHCDEHLPPIPRAVIMDISKENRRRSEENARLSRTSAEDESRVEGDGLHTIEEWKEIVRWRGKA